MEVALPNARVVPYSHGSAGLCNEACTFVGCP